jgi:predicted Rossmann fold flavoprotein
MVFKHKILIIGGGASGIMAALSAKDFGIDVALVEGNDRIGKKLLTTGNGRCNISNEYIDEMVSRSVGLTSSGSAPPQVMRFNSENEGFYLPVLKAFTVKDTVDFFNGLGLPLVVLEDGKMYPRSLQASSALDIFRMALDDRGIPLYCGYKITGVKAEKEGFKVFYKNSEGEGTFLCGKVILCTGGKSAPATGSDGSGFNIARSLGHTIIPTVPALVQLRLDYKNLKALAGVKFDGNVEVFVESRSCRKEFGEVLFTDYGISGPPILQLSRVASYSINKKKRVTLKVDMCPDMDAADLENFLENHWGLLSHRSVHDSFIGIINKKTIPVLLKEAGVENLHKPCWELEWNEKKAIYSLLKGWEFHVTDTNSYANSQVTAGGIDTREVDAETLESKLVPDLYFAGEILDVDGDCGGYNLQWAWSSGYVAAKAAAEGLK